MKIEHTVTCSCFNGKMVKPSSQIFSTLKYPVVELPKRELIRNAALKIFVLRGKSRHDDNKATEIEVSGQDR